MERPVSLKLDDTSDRTDTSQAFIRDIVQWLNDLHNIKHRNVSGDRILLLQMY